MPPHNSTDPLREAGRNGTIKSNVIDLSSPTTSYIYMNRTRNLYAAYTGYGDVVNFYFGMNVYGGINCNSDIRGARVFNAVYNDYAELYEKDDVFVKCEHGDVIEVNPLTGRYRKCNTYNSKYVVGVCSNTYGILLGGKKNVSEEENLKSYIPIGLCGRVYVKTNDSSINIGDLLVSDKDGKAVKSRHRLFRKNNVIGKALSIPKDGYVYMQVLLS